MSYAPPQAAPAPAQGAAVAFVDGTYEYREIIRTDVVTPGAAQQDQAALNITPGGFLRGVSVDRVMSAQVALNDPRYANSDQMVRTATAIIERLATSPDVDVAALVNYLPLSLIRVGVAVTIEGIAPPPGDRPWITRYFVVDPNYFVAPVKLLPDTITVFLPGIGPVLGLRPVTVGGGMYVK